MIHNAKNKKQNQICYHIKQLGDLTYKSGFLASLGCFHQGILGPHFHYWMEINSDWWLFWMRHVLFILPQFTQIHVSQTLRPHTSPLSLEFLCWSNLHINASMLLFFLNQKIVILTEIVILYRITIIIQNIRDMQKLGLAMTLPIFLNLVGY